MPKVRVAIVGASGYTGGETLRLLLGHPHVEILQATSDSYAGKPVSWAHPNLRKRTQLRFVPHAELADCDVLFLCLPHGETMKQIERFESLAERIIDLSADFRLKSADTFRSYYGTDHASPERLATYVYGIPELHREAMRTSRHISSAGCNATAVILALWPLFKHQLADTSRTIADVKTGSSEAGVSVTPGSHHPERSGAVRSYSPTGHRHGAEIMQELSVTEPVTVQMSATSIEMVRGILATCHVTLKSRLAIKDIWQVYRQEYGNEPFIRLVAENHGIFRFPEPKLLAGTNYCDIGFELDKSGERLVVISALDNLMKGAAGQAVQAFNLMHGFDETTSLEFTGLHP